MADCLTVSYLLLTGRMSLGLAQSREGGSGNVMGSDRARAGGHSTHNQFIR